MRVRLISLLLIIVLVLSLSGCYFSFPILGGGVEGVEGDEQEPSTDQPDDGSSETPIEPTSDGYTFETFTSDHVFAAADIYEASSVIDEAIAMHMSAITLDLTAFGEDFDPNTDFDPQCEFTSHVWFRYTYDAEKPHILTVHINYNTTSASKISPITEEITYSSLASGNDIISRLAVSEDKRRGESFTDFPIDTDTRLTREVYNSEELWWAIEHGNRPTFPIENSDAEKIYEQAKAILRDIIYEGMSDYEKALAIYEYVVSSVVYDHGAAGDLENVATSENACYYLEGVFFNGMAVCDGKSKAIVLLCGIEGIEAVREFGYSLDGTSGHAWNYVKIDDVWYLVDTTNGDVSKNVSSSQLAQFYGKNVEVINYKLFLTSLSTFDDKYVLSGLWKSITDTDEGQTRVSDVLANRVSDSYIDSASELSTMIRKVLDSGVNEFSLTVGVSRLISMIYGDNAPHTLMDNAISRLGLSGRLEYIVFSESIDDNKNYMYVLKLLPEAEE